MRRSIAVLIVVAGSAIGFVACNPPPPTVTAAQYGAKCDGSTDDTTAMQNAINGAVAGGDELLLPSNATCVITSTLHMPTNTDIAGGGFGSVLKFTYDGTFMSTAGGAESNITLASFSAIGSGNGEPSGLGHNNSPGIHLDDVNGIVINGIQVSNDTGVAITSLSTQNETIENSTIHNSGRDGITAFETGVQQVQNYTVQNNTISDVGDDAIAVDLPQSSSAPGPLATGIQITGNTINGWGSNGTTPNPNGKQLGRGIALNGVDGATVTGNSIDWTYSAGIMVSGCTTGWCGSTFAQHPDTNVTVQNNTISNAGQDFPFSNQGQGNQPTYGVYVYNSAAPVNITGNTITTPLSGNVLIGNPGCSGGCTIQS